MPHYRHNGPLRRPYTNRWAWPGRYDRWALPSYSPEPQYVIRPVGDKFLLFRVMSW